MFLKSITIENFRKFGKENEDTFSNTVEFIDARDYSKDYSENNKINIAPKTTLIIGKNNSGKTTIIQALDKLINGHSFVSYDFNYTYIVGLLNDYLKLNVLDESTIKTPEMIFKIVVGLDTYDIDNDDDILTNIIPFMNLGDVNESEVTIYIKWEIQERQLLINDIKELLERKYESAILFDKFLKLIDESKYRAIYYNVKGKIIDYSIKNLIEITTIRANKITGDSCLSDAFSKIIDYRYKNSKASREISQQEIASELDSSILKINKDLTDYVSLNHTKNFNNSLSTMLDSEKCQILLKSDLTFKKLINEVIEYQYQEGAASIPENQFGLGYTNLMMIIAEIISYMEKYPESSFNSKINLISIEEPETYMHPQMQENFIKSINEMITSLLENKNKHVNSQIIITTHSAHIVNSKIHQGNTFNNINYIVDTDGYSTVVCLKDEKIVALTQSQLRKIEKARKNRTIENAEQIDEESLKKYNDLSFIKKHIKFKISELFFADYVIFVEGVTEYTLLQYYLDKDNFFNKHYGSIFLIDGCHAKLYENLIAILKIPTLIITDLDIKREKSEKSEDDGGAYLQVNADNVVDRVTTNDSLKHFYSNEVSEDESKSLKILNMCSRGYVENSNLMVSTQLNLISGYYATSFEEAFILENYDNNTLKILLCDLKPEIMENINCNGGVVKNSYKLQRKLADSKSEFANKLLYMIINDKNGEATPPKLPQYITDGLAFLTRKLKAYISEAADAEN